MFGTVGPEVGPVFKDVLVEPFDPRPSPDPTGSDSYVFHAQLVLSARDGDSRLDIRVVGHDNPGVDAVLGDERRIAIKEARVPADD